MRDDSGDVGPQEGLLGLNLGRVGDFSIAELSLDLLVVVEELGEANVAGRVELDLEGSVIGGESVALDVVRSEQPLALPLVSDPTISAKPAPASPSMISKTRFAEICGVSVRCDVGA